MRNRPGTNRRIGVDLGGTKIEAVSLDGAGAILCRKRVPTPQGDYAGTLAAIAGLVRDMEAETGGQASVGVGIPGALSRASGRVKNANSTWLIGKPLEGDLAATLGRPVRLANDANCFALSEAMDGAGAGATSVFGVILGTGVGGGAVVDGRLVEGANAIAGEWGHNPLPWAGDAERPGAPCYCGKRGCIETFLSGAGLCAAYRETAGANAPSAEWVAEKAAAGDGDGRDAVARYAERLARALASVINLLDPEVIVLGGGLSNMAALYDQVPARWGEWVFSDSVETRLCANRHGDSSGVRGAAWLWPAVQGSET